MEPVGLNKASAEVADEMLRQRVVVQVVARVQMANTDARFSESDGFPGSSKLGEFFAQMPGELSRADRLNVAAILRDGRTSPDPFRIQVERLIVHPIWFGEQQVVLIDAELICQPGVCKVPRISLPAR